MNSFFLKRLKTGGLLVLILLMASLGFSQGIETFTNLPTNNSSGYQNRTWTGDNGKPWAATKARTDETIYVNNKAITLQNQSGSYMETTISGGVGDLTFEIQQKFSGSGGSVEVFIDGATVG